MTGQYCSCHSVSRYAYKVFSAEISVNRRETCTATKSRCSTCIFMIIRHADKHDKCPCFYFQASDSEDDIPLSVFKQSMSTEKARRHEKADLEDDIPLRVVKESMSIENARRHEKAAHTSRLDKMLHTNNYQRISIDEDGDCFLSAITHQYHLNDIIEHSEDPVSDLRKKCIEHLQKHKTYYEQYIENFDATIDALKQKGHWNIDGMDIIPLVVANIFQGTIHIYSSELNMPFQKIHPNSTMRNTELLKGNRNFNLAYRASCGSEHFDSVVQMNSVSHGHMAAAQLNSVSHRQAAAAQLNSVSHRQAAAAQLNSVSHRSSGSRATA